MALGFGLRLRIVDWIGDWDWELGLGIEDWDLGLGFGVWDFGLGIRD